jgi:hypothetical protein
MDSEDFITLAVIIGIAICCSNISSCEQESKKAYYEAQVEMAKINASGNTRYRIDKN